MSKQSLNKQVVRAYIAAFNRADISALKALFSPNAEIQGSLGTVSLENVSDIWFALMNSLAINLTIEEMIAEEDCVAVRYTERGTFQSSFMGHEPTGRSYELVAMEWFVIVDGKIKQRWGVRDAAAQARQIGLPIT